MTKRPVQTAWRRAVEYLREAVRKATDEARQRLSPRPASLGYARIPRR